MPRRKRVSRAETHRQHSKHQAGSFIRARTEYSTANTFNAKEVAYEKSLRSNGRLRQIHLAQMAFELAVHAPTDSRTSCYLERTAEHALKAQRTACTPHENLETALFVANMPLLTAVHIERKHPGTKSIDKAKKRLASTALQTAFDLEKTTRGATNLSTSTTDCFGALSEASVLLMLQHCATNEIHTENDQDYTPLPSLFSDNNTVNTRTLDKNSWDISVYAFDLEDHPIEIPPAHKIQVKSHSYSGRYSPDIAVVPVGILDRPRKTSVISVAKDIASVVLEAPVNPMSDSRVLRRTEHIMDILG